MQQVLLISTYSNFTSYLGGLVGYLGAGGTEGITNSFWNNNSDQIKNGKQRGTTGDPKLGIGSNTSSSSSITGLTPLTTIQLQSTSGSILGLGTTAFDFTGNTYPELCVTPLRAGRTACTLADYVENVLNEK